MEWRLINVDKTKWIQDESGYYTLIHYIKDNIVRLDIMDKDDMPVVSFQERADDVRKTAMRYAKNEMLRFISLEHASYIGAELTRCALLQNEYVQD